VGRSGRGVLSEWVDRSLPWSFAVHSPDRPEVGPCLRFICGSFAGPPGGRSLPAVHLRFICRTARRSVPACGSFAVHSPDRPEVGPCLRFICGSFAGPPGGRSLPWSFAVHLPDRPEGGLCLGRTCLGESCGEGGGPDFC